MQSHHARAEAAAEAIDQLRRQGDFGHQHQSLAAAGNGGGDDAQSTPRSCRCRSRRTRDARRMPPGRRGWRRRSRAWASVSATSLGRRLQRRELGCGRFCAAIQPRSASARQVRRLEALAALSAVARPRSRASASRARCCGARRSLGADNSRRPASVRDHDSVLCSRRLAGAQARRQCRRKDFARWGGGSTRPPSAADRR